MIKYIIRRILLLIPTLLFVTFIVFTLLFFTPGDPARQAAGESATVEAVELKRIELGLDKPFLVQYARWLWRLVTKFDMGTSYQNSQPVTREVLMRMPTTLRMAGLSICFAVFIGVPLGIVSAVKQYSAFDNIAMIFGLLGISMPLFWLGLLLILLFSVNWGIFPSSGFSSFRHMILPCLTLSVQSLAIIMRMTRSSMLEVVRQDYIRTVRAKGQKEFVIIMRHALKNAMLPIVTTIGLQFGLLLGGSVLVETIFTVPGIGRLIVESIKCRNYPVVQGSVLVVALLFAFVNLFVDIVYGFFDPRVRAQYK